MMLLQNQPTTYVSHIGILYTLMIHDRLDIKASPSIDIDIHQL